MEKTTEFCKEKNKNVIVETEYFDSGELTNRCWVKSRMLNCSEGICSECSIYKDDNIPYSCI